MKAINTREAIRDHQNQIRDVISPIIACPFFFFFLLHSQFLPFFSLTFSYSLFSLILFPPSLLCLFLLLSLSFSFFLSIISFFLLNHSTSSFYFLLLHIIAFTCSSQWHTLSLSLTCLALSLRLFCFSPQLSFLLVHF